MLTSQKTARINRAKFIDKLASGVVGAGGISVIICVLGILVFVASVAAPLFLPERLELVQELPYQLSSEKILAVGIGEYRQLGFSISSNNKLQFFDLASGKTQGDYHLTNNLDSQDIEQIYSLGQGQYSLFDSKHATRLISVGVQTQFDEQQQRTIVPDWKLISQRSVTDLSLTAVLRHDSTGDSRLSLISDGSLKLEHWRKAEGLFTSEESSYQSWNLISTALKDLIQDSSALPLLALSSNGRHAYVAYQHRLFYWYIDNQALPNTNLAVITQQRHSSAITAINLLLGDNTLLTGHANGSINSWLSLPTPTEPRESQPFQDDPTQSEINQENLLEDQEPSRKLISLRAWSVHQAPIKQITTASRSKSLLSLATDGTVGFSHQTSGRALAYLPAKPPKPPLTLASLDLRDQSMLSLNHQGGLAVWNLDASYPEGGFKAFFGRVWYEGYQEPKFIWQSSSSESEPKLSLIPLVFGTLKATFYGMLLAAPLAVFSAIYASQMMTTKLKNIIKPIFELMDAVPTVILGFLAAFWLAPLVEINLSGMLLSLGILPVVIMVTMIIVTKLSKRWSYLKRINGREFLVVAPMVALSVLLAFWLGRLLDQFWLNGPLTEWLFQRWDIYYDQRNAIIIAIALGFAVIPSVFSISEDALSNVPRRLTAASLALGASRWQTLWRVILPAASPGILAAIMLGLGRAVGETMIVLMAAGNTPLIDASIFTGMRTISANIAVEVPEAPHGSTLYRTLFLSATLLFMATFIINSIAELVRSRLKQKFRS